jgi:hypothetical protein
VIGYQRILSKPMNYLGVIEILQVMWPGLIIVGIMCEEYVFIIYKGMVVVEEFISI